MAQSLPDEVWVKVFTFLDPTELLSACQVCWHWSVLVGHSQTLWKAKCLEVPDTKVKQQIMTDKQHAALTWKEAYMDNYGHRYTRRQWLEGKMSNISSLRELPAQPFCPMDTHTWGEIFELEMNR